jgi:hypothetical protein
VRRRRKGVEAVRCKRRDLGQRLARNKRAGEPTGGRHRNLDRLGLEPGLDRSEIAAQGGERAGDALIGGGGWAFRFALRLGFGCCDAALIAAQFCGRDRRLVLLRCNPGNGLLGAAEIGIEQELRPRCHRGLPRKAVPAVGRDAGKAMAIG